MSLSGFGNCEVSSRAERANTVHLRHTAGDVPTTADTAWDSLHPRLVLSWVLALHPQNSHKNGHCLLCTGKETG